LREEQARATGTLGARLGMRCRSASPGGKLRLSPRTNLEEARSYVACWTGSRKYGSDLRAHDAPGEKRVVVTLEPRSVYAVDMSR